MNKLNLKQFYCLLVLTILSGGAAFSQGYNTTNWRFSNPKQFGFTIQDVDYFDNNNVIAVGTDGGIAKSTDGGRNWTYGVFTYINLAGLQAKPSFSDVHFITVTTAYAVGASGVMIKTTDGGVTWNMVTTPLWANAKNINTCWFLDANKGYIGGQVNNTLDSLPKIYFTLNGGATWDSIAAPASNGVARCGYINNVNVPSVLYPIDAKMKEIFRIEFLNNNIGYISGGGSPLFPRVSSNAVAATCLPSTGNLTTSAHSAALLWKFNNGVLTDYSLSKERLGYTGIVTNTVTCTSAFAGNITPAVQTYKAFNIINDSTVVLMSFNNNTVVKVHTGVNDSTLNVNAAGVYEKGVFEMLNYPFPPTQGPNAGPPIPPVQVLLASNPLRINRAASGKLIAGSTNSTFAGTPGYLWTSVDTGRNWIQELPYPQTPNIIANAPGAQCVDIAPNGRVVVLGTNGAMTDSIPGGSWQSNYVSVPVGASYSDMEFTDCNNGIAAGGNSITVTTDGGNTWIDRFSPVLQALNATINSVNYLNPAKAYFTTSIGNLYRSTNQAVTLSPVFGEPTARLFDLATAGTDSLWSCGDLFNSPLPTAQRSGVVFRSFNNGAAWDTIRVGPIGSATFITFRGIEFPTRNIGYIAGTRGKVYKTIDAGATWTDVSPSPLLIASMSFSDIQALNKDTVFVIGQGFPIKVVYRTLDGGATWTDITNNITALGVGNLNGILMHDVNNGYVMTPGGALLKTTNGGASWTLDLAPTGCLFTTAAFVPKTVGPGVNMVNRKMFVSGPNINGAPMMEYGNPANTTVNSTEAVTNVTCTAPNSGVIVITATGGLAPYTYSLNGGPYQVSNTFSGLAAGNYNISIKDAYCGILNKTVTIGLTDNLTLTTNFTDSTICQGGSVQMIATSQATTFVWTPTTALNNPNIFNPIATPAVTTTYTVTATLNSCVKTKNVNITVNANPALTIVADPGTTLCQGDPTRLTVYDIGGTAPVSFTQSGSQTPVAGSVACNAGGNTHQNSYWRAYPLTPYALPGALTINSVNFGVERNGNATLTATVNIYVQTGAAFPAGTRTLVRTQNVTVPVTLAPTVLTFPITPVTVNATDVVVIELSTPFTATSNFFIGSNSAAETAPSYISAPDCGITTPTTLAAVGFPNMHIILNFSGTVPGLAGITTGGTFLWSPAAGLSSTSTNPVAASPAVTTTYTVLHTTTAGCSGTAQITINVNNRPVVVTHPVNVSLCATGSASFSITATGTALTYQWQESSDAGVTWANLANGAPYSGVTTPTLTINPTAFTMNGYRYRCVVSGTCTPGLGNPNISNAAILTVVALPTITVAPSGTFCGGVAGISGVALNASGANTYVWAPVTGLYTDALATIPYTGTNLATVYAAPTVFTTYTVNGTNTTTGCSNTASVNVNYTPPPPVVTPNPVTMCLGDLAVKLKSTSATPGSCTVNSGAISIPIPDATATQNFTAISTQNVSCIPANATITGISVTLSIPAHTYVADLSLNLKSPGGTVINLFRNLGATGGVNTTYPNTGIVNLTLSSASATPLSTANIPAVGTLTGTFKADILNAISTPFYTLGDPPGYSSTATSWAPMFANAGGAANGNWILAMTDDGAGDIGNLTNWSIKFDYIVGVQTTPATWSPLAGLFTDPGATIAYTGTPIDSVWTRPTPSGVYNYNVTVQSVNPPPATVATPMAGGNGNNMVFFNVNNSNAISYNITGISTNAFVTAVAPTVNVYRKTSPIAGNPGAINAGNGWILVGSASNVSVTANTLNAVLTGLAITIPAGQTYGIGLEFTGAATFPAYTNGTGTVATFTNNGCSVIVDGNVGWGGPVAPGPPANNPRNFNGTVIFAPANIPACTSPARAVTVTVNQPVSITTQPSNAVVCTDKVTTFSVTATGTGITYQWQVSTDAGVTWTNISNNTIYSGTSTITLTVTAPPVSYNGYQYRCVVSGAAPCPAVISTARVLTVNPLPTVVISASPYRNLLPGLRTTLSSTSSPAAATYTWLRNGFPVAGGTNSSLVADIDGQGSYRLRVTDVNGCTNTSNEILISDSTSGIVFIYPNPNHGQFQVRYNPQHNTVTPYGLNIFDALGKRILNKQYTLGMPYSSMAVDLSNHGSGVYWVEVVDVNGDRLAMGRVVILR